MATLGDKMIAFHKASFKWIKLIIAGACLGAFILWASFKLGAMENWRKPSTLVIAWAAGIYIFYKLNHLHESK